MKILGKKHNNALWRKISKLDLNFFLLKLLLQTAPQKLRPRKKKIFKYFFLLRKHFIQNY
jgi:hypothetical protein